MLKFESLSLRRGARLLFEDVNLIIQDHQKVGITGANGCGKSSLFAMIRNQLHSDHGDFFITPNTEIAHVAQETPAVQTAAIDYVMQGDAELFRIQTQLQQAEQDHDGTLIAQLHAQLDAIDGYSAHSRAGRLLQGLGFTIGQQDHGVDTFSGGWRMRLNLAQALMCRSDLLLLDEPTNHLDLDAVIWLQQWLASYPGTLLLISHDREFLDQICTQIAHIEQQGIQLYSGNYTAFEGLRAQKLAGQQAAYQKQQREIAHIQSYVDRFRAKATKARQAQSRIKALQRLEQIAPAHVDSPFHFDFRQPEKLPSPLITMEKLDAGYHDQVLLRQIKFHLAPGDRIGLLGPNGAGKSTLIKIFADELQPLTGKRTTAKDLRIGYFAQHQLEQLIADASPIDHLQRLDPKAGIQSLRNFVGGFGFSGDMALAPVAPFSGGEKARLVLAMIVYQNPNLLLLDEPTNHLDLEMRHALGLALQEYQGAMVVVSHDRHLLRTVTDQLFLVHAGSVTEFNGDLDDYQQWLNTRATPDNPEPGTGTGNSAAHRKERKRQEAEKRKQLKPLRSQVEQLDKQLHQLQHRLTVMEQQLAEPEIYQDENKLQLKDLLQQQSQLRQNLKQTEEHWLHAFEQLEELESVT